MSTPTFGRIDPFNAETESLASYLECMALYLQANDVPEENKIPVFLSLIGSETYGHLRTLCSMAKPQDKSYRELTTLLTGHFEPEPLVIAERFHFHRRSQAAGESVADFVAELRRLAGTCKFRADLP